MKKMLILTYNACDSITFRHNPIQVDMPLNQSIKLCYFACFVAFASATFHIAT